MKPHLCAMLKNNPAMFQNSPSKLTVPSHPPAPTTLKSLPPSFFQGGGLRQGNMPPGGIPHRQINITSVYQVVAIEVNLSKTFTVLSFYIPPCQDISINEISNIISSITTPLLILGDFNSWNTIWGSTNNNNRGILMENIIERTDLCILNNGSPTHFSTHNTYSHIDLSLCSLDLLPLASWDVLNDLHGSDHFPIKLILKLSEEIFRPVKAKKFLLHKADWYNFSNSADKEIASRQITQSSNQCAATVTKCILSAANCHIPQLTHNYRPARSPVPWWNDALADLRHLKMKAWQKFKSAPHQENLIAYKKQNAIFRRELRKAKILSFKRFTEDIHRDTPISTVWDKINRITRKSSTTIIKTINTQHDSISDPNKIANHFGEEWAKYSSDENFPPLFNSAKNSTTASFLTVILAKLV
ncbi:putative RNA-directed DNA polymerase from transposon X-element [Lucilia cuprina]|nr:putative RNA-directed DNA polymerase from transposon X-element [Lucilia cuprina]